jgi:phosphatidylinositol 4-kinase B
VVQHGNGKIKSKKFQKAQKNFCYSLAAYSLAQYILQIKDRHNQNIMIDAEGHVIHIDYGFLLSNAPGRGLKFEQAPFKLTTECVNVLGGVRGKYYKLFRDLVKLGFMALQEHADKIIILVEMMMLGQKDLPCFQDGEQTVVDLKTRLFPTQKVMSEAEAKRFTEDLISSSENNWRTNLYDTVQYCCQGII